MTTVTPDRVLVKILQETPKQFPSVPKIAFVAAGIIPEFESCMAIATLVRIPRQTLFPLALQGRICCSGNTRASHENRHSGTQYALLAVADYRYHTPGRSAASRFLKG